MSNESIGFRYDIYLAIIVLITVVSIFTMASKMPGVCNILLLVLFTAALGYLLGRLSKYKRRAVESDEIELCEYLHKNADSIPKKLWDDKLHDLVYGRFEP